MGPAHHAARTADVHCYTYTSYHCNFKEQKIYKRMEGLRRKEVSALFPVPALSPLGSFPSSGEGRPPNDPSLILSFTHVPTATTSHPQSNLTTTVALAPFSLLMYGIILFFKHARAIFGPSPWLNGENRPEAVVVLMHNAQSPPCHPSEALLLFLPDPASPPPLQSLMIVSSG